MSKKEKEIKTKTDAAADEKKKKKDTDKKASKKLNIKIAPGNWQRIEKFINDFNGNPERTASKLKYTTVINEALSVYFEKKTDTMEM